MIEVHNLNPTVNADSAPVEVVITHPDPGQKGAPLVDEEGNKVVFQVWGRDSSKWQNFMDEERRKNAGQPYNPDDEESLIKRCLAHCTESTPDNLLVEGEKREPLDIYRREDWIYQQVIAGAANRANVYQK